MILSDRDIKDRITYGSLSISPLSWSNIEPSSVDLRLGSDMKTVTREETVGAVDLQNQDDSALRYDETPSVKDGAFVLYPGVLYLGTTREFVRIPDDISANVLGRSSLGRIGLSVHQTAGYIDPGFEGEITLELVNHGPSPIRVRPDDRICQIVFHELTSPAEKPYGHSGSQYQEQRGATPSGMRFD